MCVYADTLLATMLWSKVLSNLLIPSPLPLVLLLAISA